MKTLRTQTGFLIQLALVLALVVATAGAAETGRKFISPEAAVSALAQAVSTTNLPELRAIFGPAAGDILNPDPVMATNEFATFARALAQSNRFVAASDAQPTVDLGDQARAFPGPLVATTA